MRHARRRSPWLVTAGTLAVAFAGPAAARAQSDTRACQIAIQNEAGVFVQRRSNPIEACLRAILACREKAKPTQAAACRAKLVLPGAGACAVGTLDAGVSTLGTGAAAIAAEDMAGTDKLSTALRTLVTGLETDCFGPDPAVNLVSGLGFTPAPADARELADRLNRVPGGLGCLANVEVGITTPLANALLAEVAPYDGRCAAADLPGGLYKKACATDGDCGPTSGRCGQLAYVLKEGGAGLSHCESCMPGASRVGGACQPCRPGGYSTVVDAPSCTACATGSFTNVEGSTSCSACPVGRYQALDGQILCTQCAPGKYTNQVGSVSCADCTAGTFSDEGAAQCTACSPGTFSFTGSLTCKPCAAGEYSGKGAPSCTLCAAGRYSDDGAAACVLCPAGRYAADVGSPSCAACAAGTYAESPGTVTCAACKAGSFSVAEAAACTLCPANTISGVAAASCTPCPANSTANADHTACQCNLGFYLPSDSKQCAPCPDGAVCTSGGILTDLRF